MDEVEVLEKKKSALELLEEAKRFTITMPTFPVRRIFSSSIDYSMYVLDKQGQDVEGD